MFCANCGKEIPPPAHFCPSCGRPVEAAAARPTAPPLAGAAAAVSPTPAKKMALWKKIALGVVGFIVVVVVIALWATSGVIEPIDHQLAALKRGDLQAPYAETSTGFRDTVSFEKFEAFVKQYPALSHNASNSFSSRSANADGTGSAKDSLTDDHGGVLPVQYKLVKENGARKILGIHLGMEKK